VPRAKHADGRAVRIKQDDHDEDIRLLLDRLPTARTGVIHVGAHLGEEVPAYLEAGFSRVVLIEANPRLLPQLESRFGGDERVSLFSCAITDRDGDVDLQLHTSRTGSVEPASILPLGRFKEIVKTLHTPATMRVPGYSLDSFLLRNALEPGDFSLLNVDVQGAELLVLEGARRTLATIPAVISEVSPIALYDGGAIESEVVAFLTARGFSRIDGVYHTLHDGTSTFPAWGECLFVSASARD